MKRHAGIGAVLLPLIAAGWVCGGEPLCCEPGTPRFLHRIAPVGGWFPYGGGLFHWWPKHCFPCCNLPDDYCRKPLPKVCWPPYPPYYFTDPKQPHVPAANGTADRPQGCWTGF
jgi:hypothetical protein